ncbi:MAG: DNA polymerase/3'-5' exonuclease PolX [Candidatus Eisenbacteria bacterium]
MKNEEIVGTLSLLADVLEIKGANAFRVNAYRRASRVVESLSADVAQLAESGELRDIPGIGDGIASLMEEFVESGTMSVLESERKTIPRGLVELLSVPGLGPKTIGLLWSELNVRSLSGLKRALRGGKILDLPGMGAKKVENLRAGVVAYESRSGRLTLGVVLPIARGLIDALADLPEVREIEQAGSVRRFRETIGDIDVLVASTKPEAVVRAFTELPSVEEVLAAGATKASVRVSGALQVDLRVVDPASWGAALVYFTGSADHNVRLRGLAQDLGMKLNEYALTKGDRRVAARTEEGVYGKLGLQFIPPELREDRGEVDAALEGELPELIELEDVRGDLHVHSDWSDGHASIEEMARASKHRGYRYMSVNDHSRSLGVAHGLTPERLERQMSEIDDINGRVKGFTVLKGTEVDILSDGSLDLPDELLERLDVVVASIHSGFSQSSDRITARMVSAIENPHVDVIGHPTGRLLGTREPYAVDMERVMGAAAENGTALEINAYHERLDLCDVHARRAAELGVRIVISTDSHRPDDLASMELGVRTARRGWLTRADVLNTLPLGSLRKMLRTL